MRSCSNSESSVASRAPPFLTPPTSFPWELSHTALDSASELPGGRVGIPPAGRVTDKTLLDAWVRTTMYCHICNQKLDFVVEIIRAIITVGVEFHTYRDVLRHATDSQ